MVTVNVRLQRHHPEPAIPASGRGNECTGLAEVGVVVGSALGSCEYFRDCPGVLHSWRKC